MAPLASIVTPVLNRRETLEACLRSVADQTYPNIEHIVVDGGSTDGTIDLLREWEPRVKWISESDTGMYNAINKGLAMTTGDFVAYVNSDDLYLPYSVEAAVEVLTKDHDLVFGDLGVLTRERDPVGFYPQFYRDFDLNHYTHFATLAQPTVFWTRALMERTGTFDESYRLLGDCEYWLRAAVKGARITHLDEILAVQVEHEGTLRVTQPEQLQAEFARLRADYTKHAGPPAGQRLEHPRRSVHWRYHQLLFAIAGAKSRPARWGGFMKFLDEHRVPKRPAGLAWFLLPQPLRPVNASLVDGPALERVLFGGRN
ncbi:MAG TPA: glycosyltransferase family 2 protein [Actinomycetota bacterium]|nr:glycosyltransferase family 2 protein [Actinomycetota bacterium]